MPTIELPQSLFERLQALATPFVDTPASVINRLLDSSAAPSAESTASSNQDRDASILRFTPAEPPNLTDTRIQIASFNGLSSEKTNWNDLVGNAHRIALDSVAGVSELINLTTANVWDGVRRDKGYRPVEGTGFSIQGVDANEAWRILYHLARKTRCPLEVQFEWRFSDKAEMPGQVGVLSWKP